MWLTLLSGTITGTQTIERLDPLPLSVAENVLILTCFIYDPGERGTKIDGLRVFRVWHEYLRVEKQTGYNALPHFIYLQYIQFMHLLHMLILFKVP